MSTELNPLPSDLCAQETILASEPTPVQAPVKQKWETPELRIVATQETESGIIHADFEVTTKSLRKYPS